MSPLRPSGFRAGPVRLPHPRTRMLVTGRRAFTFIELILTFSILSMLGMVIVTLLFGMQNAWSFVSGIEETRLQGEAVRQRIQRMMGEAGTYHLTGGHTVLGIGIVSQTAGTLSQPSTLVIWSGGSNGGMAAQGEQARLPLASELVVYTPLPSDPTQLGEVTFPSSTVTVDFTSGTFAATINTLLGSTGAVTNRLTDRLKTIVSPANATTRLGAARFEMAATPTDAALNASPPAGTAWTALPWQDRLYSSTGGQRSLRLKIELQLEPLPQNTYSDSTKTTAYPVFGAAFRSWWYET